uniref:Uncharacterized protein n=1 Tax=Calcidiscus leptoporus TaxID=127549 RepID=A0A7S0P686_9EUKA
MNEERREQRAQAAAIKGLVGIGKAVWASTAPRPQVMDGEKDPRTSDMEGWWFTFCWPCFCACHEQEATGPDSLRYKNICCCLLYVLPMPCPPDERVREADRYDAFISQGSAALKPDYYTGPRRKCGGPACSCLCCPKHKADDIPA